MSWNQQKVEDLKKLWNDGVATSRIGEQLGFTKNAVIGKAFRLGLERRQNSRKKISQPASFSSTTLYRETSSSSSSISVKKEPIRRREKFSFKKSIVGTGNFRSCQWPIGDPLEEGFHYCGGQNIPTKPYCIEHFKKAYNVDEKYLDRLLDFLHEKN
ncbi:global cell cycle regulator GcrA-like protein [Alphaproteobacteria bacterium]|jgi:GcrA cell cycle regulator|nr:global cell cycle regulator GcrA-like protein [Alphaproteobacteria bacterium]MDB2635892.1 global cell cycle regulator GcrA-like protein [Alphaproteobacteria bacterium]MDB3974089.1 global cell cycle regulator GcrA-like protein [Alphaproteobacteria bacterium]